MSSHNEAWARLQRANRKLDQANDLMTRYAERYVESGAEFWVELMRDHLVVVRAARAEAAAAAARWWDQINAPQRVVADRGAVAEDYLVGWSS